MKYTNTSKSVPFNDLHAELAAFSEEGFELITSIPLNGGDGQPWGYELFFKKPEGE